MEDLKKNLEELNYLISILLYYCPQELPHPKNIEVYSFKRKVIEIIAFLKSDFLKEDEELKNKINKGK